MEVRADTREGKVDAEANDGIIIPIWFCPHQVLSEKFRILLPGFQYDSRH